MSLSVGSHPSLSCFYSLFYCCSAQLVPFPPRPCTCSSYARASAVLRGSGCGMKPENSALGSTAHTWRGSEEGNRPLQTLNGRFPASAWKSLGFPAGTELQEGP